VRKELDLAESARRQIVPVMLEAVDIPDTMKYQLAGVHYVDLSTDATLDISPLLEALKHGPKQPFPAPAPVPQQPVRRVAPKVTFGEREFHGIESLANEQLVWSDIHADKYKTQLSGAGFLGMVAIRIQVILTDQRVILTPHRNVDRDKMRLINLADIQQVEKNSNNLTITTFDRKKHRFTFAFDRPFGSHRAKLFFEHIGNLGIKTRGR
jgi:hypothetical protein